MPGFAVRLCRPRGLQAHAAFVGVLIDHWMGGIKVNALQGLRYAEVSLVSPILVKSCIHLRYCA